MHLHGVDWARLAILTSHAWPNNKLAPNLRASWTAQATLIAGRFNVSVGFLDHVIASRLVIAGIIQGHFIGSLFT